MGFLAASVISIVRVVLAFLGAIRVNPLGNRVAVDAERFGRVGNSLLVAREGFLYVELFKL